jgi:hypothetical protein
LISGIDSVSGQLSSNLDRLSRNFTDTLLDI